MITSAVIVAAGLVGAGDASADAGWQPTVLVVPDGWRGGAAFGTDGRGEYSGTLYDVGGGSAKLAIWRGGALILVDPPSGCTEVAAVDENASRVIVVRAGGCGSDGYGQRAYTYSGGAYRELSLVGDGSNVYPVAINERGDVLGQTGPTANVTVVWRPAADPIVIPNTLAWQWPVDIDDDGTVLFSTADAGSYLWRDGTLSPLTTPPSYGLAWGSEIRDGVVVGRAAATDSGSSSAYWWPRPNAPKRLRGGSSASYVNATGLVVGRASGGDLLTWQGGTPAGSLPVPAGYDSVQVNAVGDDGTVVGMVGLYNIDKPFDMPIVWRR